MASALLSAAAAVSGPAAGSESPTRRFWAGLRVGGAAQTQKVPQLLLSGDSLASDPLALKSELLSGSSITLSRCPALSLSLFPLLSSPSWTRRPWQTAGPQMA